MGRRSYALDRPLTSAISVIHTHPSALERAQPSILHITITRVDLALILDWQMEQSPAVAWATREETKAAHAVRQ